MHLVMATAGFSTFVYGRTIITHCLRLVSKEWLSGPDAGCCMLILGAGMFIDGLWQQSNAEYYTRLGDKENILFDQVHMLNYIII